MRHAARHAADLAGLRRELRARLHALGLRGDVVDELTLATTEVVTNGLVVAHPRTSVTTTVVLRPVEHGDLLQIEVRNVGAPFPDDHATDGEPDMPPATALRGRGLAVAHRLTDAVRVERLVGGTAVRLSRFVPARDVPIGARSAPVLAPADHHDHPCERTPEHREVTS